jgi:diguanylate cyclase (GGDEF)-like protein
VDVLTRVSVRAAGFLALERDISRARREAQSLVVGFVDVDHLKSVNDRDGHAAGDQTLLNVAHALRSHLRAYDVIFRYGGDEFVCALSGVDVAFCEARMTEVNRELAERSPAGSVTVGFAALHPEDSSADLVARADSDLYRKRQEIRRSGS